MQEEPAGGAEDQEPGNRRSGPAPPKKPLAEFLAEFEQRLLDHPQESATSALQVVEDRAGGQRRAAVPGATTRGPAPPDSPGSPTASPSPDLSPPPSVAIPGKVAPPGTPGPLAEAGQADTEGSKGPDAAPEGAAETRRLRGRRRRRHRHRAH